MLPFEGWVNVFVSDKAADAPARKAILETGRLILVLGNVAYEKAECRSVAPITWFCCRQNMARGVVRRRLGKQQDRRP
jgi:hypothetical protein